MTISKVIKKCEDLSQYHDKILSYYKADTESPVSKKIEEYCALREIPKGELTVKQKQDKLHLKTALYTIFKD